MSGSPARPQRNITRVAFLLSLSPVAVPALLAQETTTLGGYGEVHYVNRSGANTPGEVNVKRFVLYLAHTFNDRITFRSELELEDTKLEGGEDGGEVALEQAYLDYRVSPALTLRAGLVLIPIGIINETHEPPTFNGVARPSLEQDLIPSTWREIGVGIVGALPHTQGVNYRLYVVNGLQAEGFSAGRGIRGGRQEGKEASFANPSITGRLEWARPGLRLGGSFWYGGSADQDPALGTGTFENAISVLSADARIEQGGFTARGVVARISIADAQEIRTAFGNPIGDRLTGGYLEGGYDILSALAPTSQHTLTGFVRHERYNTNASVPAGPEDPTLARRITTIGLTWKPVYNVAFKADFQLRRNRGNVGEHEVTSFGVGYAF